MGGIPTKCGSLCQLWGSYKGKDVPWSLYGFRASPEQGEITAGWHEGSGQESLAGENEIWNEFFRMSRNLVSRQEGRGSVDVGNHESQGTHTGDTDTTLESWKNVWSPNMAASNVSLRNYDRELCASSKQTRVRQDQTLSPPAFLKHFYPCIDKMTISRFQRTIQVLWFSKT